MTVLYFRQLQTCITTAQQHIQELQPPPQKLQEYLHLLWKQSKSDINRAPEYKTFFMLNSVEHEILNSYKYKKYQEIQLFQAQVRGECYFSCS